MNNSLFITGATGFIRHETVVEGVNGPGKVFVEQFVSGLQHGTAHIIGKGENRLPLTYVTDAARALIHLAGLAKTDVVGRVFIAMDGADATRRMLLEATADAMDVKRPGSAPPG